MINSPKSTRFLRCFRTFSLLLALLLLLPACGKEKGSGDGKPAGLLQEICFYDRSYGEKESANRLTRTLRFTVLENGHIQKDSLDGEGNLYLREIYSGDVLFHSESYEDGKPARIITNSIDENGHIVESSESDGENTIFLSHFGYDDHGTLTYEQLSRREDGKLAVQYTHRYENSYDEAGNLTEQIYTCEEEPSQNSHTRWSYDEKGGLLKTAVLRYDREYEVTEYRRDAQGNILEERHLEDGVLKYMLAYRYEYDSEGRILRRDSGDGSGEFPSRTEYSYDAAGERIRILNSTNGKPVSESQFSTAYAADNGGADRSFPLKTVQTDLRYGTDGTPDPAASYIYTTVFRCSSDLSPENAKLSEAMLALAGF